MAIKKTIWCDECGAEFESEEEAKTHEERNCVPWVSGDRVLFQYHLLTFPGTITLLGSLVGPGETRIAHVESDEQLEDADWSQAYTGRNFIVPVITLQRLLNEAE